MRMGECQLSTPNNPIIIVIGGVSHKGALRKGGGIYSSAMTAGRPPRIPSSMWLCCFPSHDQVYSNSSDATKALFVRRLTDSAVDGHEDKREKDSGSEGI